MQFIPYGLFRAFRGLDLRDPTTPVFTARTAKVDGGLDSKFILKKSLVLDFTVEPDFSQIESDQPQVQRPRGSPCSNTKPCECARTQ